MKLYFREDTHEYWLEYENGRTVDLISTTQLMEKHGLSVDYGEIPIEVLEKASLFGSINHAWLEKYFKGLALKSELPDFVKKGVSLLENNGFSEIASEQKVHNEFIAGTVDLIALKDDKLSLVDFKFTYNYNHHAVTWQLNIYRLLVRYSLNLAIEELYCLWYNKRKKEFELRKVPIIDDSLIFKLFQDELENKRFLTERTNDMDRVNEELQIDNELKLYDEVLEYAKRLEGNIELLKEQLIREMEVFGIKEYESKEFRFVLVNGKKKYLKITRKDR